MVDRAVEAHVALEAGLLAGLDARERERLADLLRRLGFSIERHHRRHRDDGAPTST
jgi:hypothetical protein